MAENSHNQTSPSGAIELKSGSITLPILKVLTHSLVDIASQLDDKLGKAPEFFRNAPIIIDLGDLAEDRKHELDFSALLKLVHDLALAPVGMRGGNADQQKAAQEERLAVLADVKTEPTQGSTAKTSQNKRPIPRPIAVSTKIIDQPVRSGQRIYASGGDLIVMAQVSPGAEIMADGNIHVYGSLKGRALAGVQGNQAARIYCSDLQAQLVAIGGNYRTSESDDLSIRGKLVQIYLKDDSLIIDAL
ncbi:MAG: septum site-determining protein MinC [Methylococcaceae bacterium]|jgi:septum site-determining protein MinC